MRTTLRPIDKTFNTTLRVARGREGQPLRRECWSAVTQDGEWGFERIEDTGTPWVVTWRPGTDEEEQIPSLFGTLQAARQAVDSGRLQTPPVARAEHARGERAHPQNVYQACPGVLRWPPGMAGDTPMTYARYKSSSYVVHILAGLAWPQGQPPALCGQWPHRVWSVTDSKLRQGDTICAKCLKVEALHHQTDPLLDQAFTPEDLAEQRDAAREVGVETHLQMARKVAELQAERDAAGHDAWCACDALRTESTRLRNDNERLSRVADSLINERDKLYLRIGVYVAALEQIRSAPPPALTVRELFLRPVAIANRALTEATPEKA